MLDCLAVGARDVCVTCQPPCKESKHLKTSQILQVTQENWLAPLACCSQCGDSGGRRENALLTPRNCSWLTGIPRAATRNLRRICPKKIFPPEIGAECKALP
jgi:hypothetical protein